MHNFWTSGIPTEPPMACLYVFLFKNEANKINYNNKGVSERICWQPSSHMRELKSLLKSSSFLDHVHVNNGSVS